MPACTVHVTEAPPEVAAQIQVWVEAEPRCGHELFVSVAAVDDGYELAARDETGEVRRRVVADAESAAVLVVSWMADDTDDETPAARAPVAAIDTDSPFVAAPLVVRDDRIRPVLAIGALASDDRVGLRAQLDLLGGAHWAAGLAASWRAPDGDRDRMAEHTGPGSAGFGTAYLAGTYSLGRVSVRAQLGLGVAIGREGDVDPTAEAALLADVPLRGGLGLVGGPVVDATPNRDPERSFFVGVRYRR